MLFIGIANSDFFESGRHINIQNLGEKGHKICGIKLCCCFLLLFDSIVHKELKNFT